MTGQKPPGKLYLIPSDLGEGDAMSYFPPQTLETLRRLTHFIVEKEKTARRFLRAADHPLPIREIFFYEMPKHSSTDARALLTSCLDGNDVGLLSEAGAPCVADPGNVVVAEAHALEIEIVPLVGPSSLLLALMASGMNGQRFAFVGYLPSKREALIVEMKKLEKRAFRNNETILFIETPYRNRQILEVAAVALRGNTRFGIAAALLNSGQYIRSQSMHRWVQKGFPELHKIPAVFSIYTGTDR